MSLDKVIADLEQLKKKVNKLTTIEKRSPNQPIVFSTATGEKILTSGDPGVAASYGIGYETNAQYYRANVNHRFYVATLADGGASARFSVNQYGAWAAERLNVGVAPTASQNSSMDLETATGVNIFRATRSGNVIMSISKNASNPVVLNSNAVGSTSAGFRFADPVTIGNINPGALQLQIATDSAGKPATGTWSIVSDARAKKQITEYAESRALLERLRPVKYKYNGAYGTPVDDKEHVGFLAQEIAEIAPDWVQTNKRKLPDNTEEEYLIINVWPMFFAMLNTLKELLRDQDNIKADVAKLKGGNPNVSSASR